MTLISQQATLLASNEAFKKQAESASEAAKKYMEENDQLKKVSSVYLTLPHDILYGPQWPLLAYQAGNCVTYCCRKLKSWVEGPRGSSQWWLVQRVLGDSAGNGAPLLLLSCLQLLCPG